MRCKIAELLVDIPEAGGLAPCCRGYLTDGENTPADIVIDAAQYRAELYPPEYREDEEFVAYMESGRQFFRNLLKFNGMMLHSSALEYQGKAYLFSGPSGVGKSTHSKLWQQTFGSAAQVFNDDKPILRFLDGRWFAYGAPWCGKDDINQNKKVPLAGICFMRQGKENTIRQLSPQEAAIHILWQTQRFLVAENLDRLLPLVDRLAQTIPVYELENDATRDSVRLSCETMRRGAEEAGL